MKSVFGIVFALSLLVTVTAHAQNMTVTRNGDRTSIMGPGKYFTGVAIIDPVFPANAQLQATGGVVTFAPGARSAWHSHPAGQMMIVTAGRGWVQEQGGKRIEIKAGDVVWTPPGVKHWHGATMTTSMSHFVISNMLNGKNVLWMEKVSDKQYAPSSE